MMKIYRRCVHTAPSYNLQQSNSNVTDNNKQHSLVFKLFKVNLPGQKLPGTIPLSEQLRNDSKFVMLN